MGHYITFAGWVVLLGLGGAGAAVVRADSASHAALPALPDATPPGKPHFDSLGAHVGEQLPALPVYTLEGKPVALDESWGQSATLLLTASYTCPKSRSTYPKAAALAAMLKGRVNVAFIYVIEAHPTGDPSPYSGEEDVTNENRRDHVLCAQPRTLDERLALAREFQRRLEVSAPIFVDAMDNAAWKSLGGGPNMGVLVDRDGTVLARQGWFDADSMKNAADAFLAAAPVEKGGVKEASFRENFDKTEPTVDGKLEQLKAQIAASPGLVTEVLPYEPRGGWGDMTLLHYAAGAAFPKPQHLEIVQLLIAKGADVNKQTEHTPTALHLAAKNGHLPIARFLIEHGADVNAKSLGHGPTPLQESLISNHADMAELLVKSGARSNFFSDVATGNIEAVRAALAADGSVGLRPDGSGRPPLAYAAAAGQLRMATLLLDAGARDASARHFYGFNPRCAIGWAVRSKRPEMVRLLCERGSDPHLLDEAIFIGSSDEVVRELLAHRADPNRSDAHGYFPLHHAAGQDRLEIARMLLDAGADPNAPTGPDVAPCGSGTSDYETPLHLAAMEGSSKVALELIKRGARLNPVNATGQTPLHFAAKGYGEPATALGVVKVLVEAKAELNAKDSQGQTPLDCAIQADRTAKTPDLAVVEFMRVHGAKPGSAVPGPNAAPAGGLGLSQGAVLRTPGSTLVIPSTAPSRGGAAH